MSSMFKKLLTIPTLFLLSPTSVLAQIPNTPGDAIGTITPPPGTREYMRGGTENQLLPFISTLLTVATVVAGLWVLINVILAAIGAITASGDAQAMSKVRTNLTNSFIGILLIVLAYTLAALAGAIFFGDPTLFINPTF